MPSSIILTPSTPTASDSQRGIVDLAESAENGAVEFAEAFAGVPTVNLTVMGPDATEASLLVTLHTVSAAGFSFNLGAPTPAAGYKLHWHAIY